jgi:Mrp family chromosome partitioning ATPase
VIARPTQLYEALRNDLVAAVTPPDSNGSLPRYRGERALKLPSLGDAFLDRCRMPLGRLVGIADGGVIGICSARRHEGRSSVAAAFAILLSRRSSDARVLLLDMDLANGSQADMHAVAPSPGLADYLEGRERLRAVAGGPNKQLWLITAGTRLGDPATLFHVVAENSLLSAFRRHFPWVVIDLPPLLGNPEAATVAAQTDWPVMVGRHRRTTLADVRAARELIGEEKTAAFLMTADRTRMPRWIRRLL